MTFSSIMTNYASPVAKGISFGNMMTVMKRNEDTVRQGRNQFLAVSLQIPQMLETLKKVGVALEAAKRQPMHWTAKAACLISPALIAWCSSRDISNLRLRKVVNFLHDNISVLAHLVSVVSLVVLCVYGQALLATTSLIFLGIGILDRNNILPLKMRNAFRSTGFLVGNLTALVLGDVFSKIFAVIDIAMTISNYVAKRKLQRLQAMNQANARNSQTSQTPQQQPFVMTPLTSTQFQNIRANSALKFNPLHINYNWYPPISAHVKVSDLLTLFDTIPWQNHLKVVRDKLNKDPRWRQVARRPGQEIKYVRDQLSKFLNSVEKRTVKHGEPVNYGIIERQLRFVAEQLPKRSEIEQVDILLNLAVEGGEYCGPAKTRVSAESEQTLLAISGDVPLHMRIHNALQQERGRVFQKLYFSMWNSNPFNYFLGKIVGADDIHVYNQWTIILGKGLGLPEIGASQDATAAMSPMAQYVAQKFMTQYRNLFWTEGEVLNFSVKPQPGVSRWKFWKRYKLTMGMIPFKGYNEKDALEVVRKMIGTPQIQNEEITKWLQKWIKDQKFSESVEKQLLEDVSGYLNPPQLFGEEVDSFDLKTRRVTVNEKFIKALLVQMGVYNPLH